MKRTPQSGNALLGSILALVAISTTTVAIMFNRTAQRASALQRDETSATAGDANIAALNKLQSALRVRKDNPLPTSPQNYPLIFPEPYLSPSNAAPLGAIRALSAKTAINAISGSVLTARHEDPRFIGDGQLETLYKSGSAGVSTDGLATSLRPIKPIFDAVHPYYVSAYMVEAESIVPASQKSAAKGNVAIKTRGIVNIPPPPRPTCTMRMATHGPIWQFQPTSAVVTVAGVSNNARLDVGGNPAAPDWLPFGVAGAVSVKNAGANNSVSFAAPSIVGRNTLWAQTFGVDQDPLPYPGTADNGKPGTCSDYVDVKELPGCQFSPSETTIKSKDGGLSIKIGPTNGNGTDIVVAGVGTFPGNAWTTIPWVNIPKADGTYTINAQAYASGYPGYTCQAIIHVNTPPPCPLYDNAWRVMDQYINNGAFAYMQPRLLMVGHGGPYLAWLTNLTQPGPASYPPPPYNGGPGPTNTFGHTVEHYSCPWLPGQDCFGMYPNNDTVHGIYYQVINPDDNTCWVNVNPRILMGCFAEDTLIAMADGSMRRADRVRQGDYLLNPATHQPAEVERVTAGPEKKPLWDVRSGGAHVVVTEGHPFLTAEGLRAAKDLRPGALVFGADSGWHAVDRIDLRPDLTGRTVWNFAVKAASSDPADHLILADGVVTGDLFLQEQLAKGAPP